MDKKKYLLFPGPVISENGRDQGHISALMLTTLYGINPRECLVWGKHLGTKRSEAMDLIPLFPDPFGEYRIIG